MSTVSANLPAEQISHSELRELLSRLQFGVDASDLHGSLCGFLSGGGQATADNWLAALALELADDETVLPQHERLEHFFRDCRRCLTDPELGFALLLPEDDTQLAERAAALVEWCRGFLGGLGLAGVHDVATLSADASEIVTDFGKIAASDFEFEDAQEDESALTEVIEFVRVGALLLFGELNSGQRPRDVTIH